MSIKSLNKVCLIGNVGQEPKTGTTKNDKPWATFSLATSESYKNKNGEWQEETEWHTVKTFNERICNLVTNFVKKGSKIYIEGQIKTRKWTDDSGADRYSTEIFIPMFGGELILLDKKEQKTNSESIPDVIDDEIPWH